MDLEGHTGELLVWLNPAPKGLGVMYTAPSTDECPLGKLNIRQGDSSQEAQEFHSVVRFSGCQFVG